MMTTNNLKTMILKKLKRFKKYLKKIKPIHILIIIFLLVFNTYAWFIYATEVSTGLSVHVRSWKILFKNEDVPIVDYLNIDVDSIYPGMEDYINELEAYNLSESKAIVSYEILSARILDTEYKSVEGYHYENLEVPEDAMTSEELATMLRTNFPFKLEIDIENEELDAEIGVTKYIIKLYWPYESGDDDLDTYWGNRAYEYNETHPKESSLNFRIRVRAIQN